MTEEDDWKQRYLSEARDWESTDKLLRKVATRLAIAAEGYSPVLDDVLSSIQTHIRSGELRELEADLGELTRQIKGLDMGGASASSAPVAAPTSSSTQSEETSRGANAAIASPGEPSSAASTLAAPSSRSTAAGQPTSKVAMAEDTREVLLTLIDEFSVTNPGSGAFETLRETLQSDRGSDWHRVLERLIAEIRGLIQRISSDKQALQQLMQEVGVELGGISQSLGDDYSGLQEGREQALAMHEAMDVGVQDIQSRIASESDIDVLKLGVGQALESIRTGISEFIEKDAERFTTSEARNAALRARIAKMEEETEQLQQKLNRNQEKLMRDTLTGVRSRLAYDESLAQEMSRFRRYAEAFCLVILDIDFFKRVNDNFGHAAGDKALQLVASIIGEQVRETDLLFRVGGEEFVLLLPRTAPDAALPLVETVREAVADSGFHYEDKPVQITLSAGLTMVRADDTDETLFARADDAMYRAKKAGRNQVVSLI